MSAIKSLILPLNFPKGGFQPRILHFWTTMFRQEGNFPTAQNLEGALVPLPPLPRLNCLEYNGNYHVTWKLLQSSNFKGLITLAFNGS